MTHRLCVNGAEFGATLGDDIDAPSWKTFESISDALSFARQTSRVTCYDDGGGKGMTDVVGWVLICADGARYRLNADGSEAQD